MFYTEINWTLLNIVFAQVIRRWHMGQHKTYCIFVFKIFFAFTNSVDQDKMQHNAVFYLGLYLKKYILGVSKIQKV